MDDEAPRPRPLREWREKILSSSDELNFATGLWLKQSEHFYATLLDGEHIGFEPRGLFEMTYLLASVCDIGPMNIDPTPLTDFERLARRLRYRSQGKSANVESAATDTELEQLGDSLERAKPVLNRMTWAMVALERKEQATEPLDFGTLTPAEQDIVDAISENGGSVKSRQELFDLLADKGKVPSLGTTNIYVAGLVRRGVLLSGTNRRGYRLPD